MGMRQGNRKRVRELRRSLRRKRLAMALVAAFAMPIAPVLAQSLPENGTVTHGSASINTSGSTMTVQQGTPGAIIDWGTFNIATGNSVAFLQPDTSSVTLNRVVTFGAPSLIDGTLTANGSVFLVNPAGIAFGSGAQVNVGGLIASTLDIADEDFIAGVNSRQFDFNVWDGGQATVENAGTITAYGVAFLGTHIANHGLIDVGGGNVTFAGGRAVQLAWDPFGSAGVKWQFITPGPDDQILFEDGSDIRGFNVEAAASGNIVVRGVVRFHGTTAVLDGLGGTVSIGADCDGVFCGAGYLESHTRNLILQGSAVQVLSGEVGGSGGPDERSRIVLYGDADGIASGITFHADTMRLDAGVEISTIPGASIFMGGSLVGATNTFEIDDTAIIVADVWKVYAQSWEIIHSGDTAYGAFLTDGLLSNTLDNGTSIGIYADGASTSGSIGSIRVNEGVTITHATDDAVALGLVAASYIYGNDFSIESTGGALDLSFEATGGAAWLFDAGLASNGGNVSIEGYGVSNGVHLDQSTISAGDGDIAITGTGTGAGFYAHHYYYYAPPRGVTLHGSNISTTGGNITVAGNAAAGVGVILGNLGYGDSSIVTTTGDISVSSTGRYGLNVADVPFSTDTGDIHLEGHALGSGPGVYVGSGGLTTNGGDITLIGYSADDQGVHVRGGDIASHGGSISITGASDSTYLVSYGVLVNAGVDIDSDGGAIVIDGDSAGGSGVWLNLEGGGITSGGGNITLTGAGGGLGGVDILYGVVDSAGGAISIYGTANGRATGVALESAGLSSSGGDIDIVGHTDTNAPGVWVRDSEIVSAGGDVDIAGSSAMGNGVSWRQSTLASSGGDIALVGSGQFGGLELQYGTVSSGAGDITINGNATNGVGITFDIGSSVTTTSGTISIVSTGLTGLNLATLPITTDTGDIHLEGHAQSGPGVYVGSGGLTTNGGDITIDGTSEADSYDNGSGDPRPAGVVVMGDIASNGGDIAIHGSSPWYEGVIVDGADIITSGGMITLVGQGGEFSANGVWVVDAGLLSGGGDIVLDGDGWYGGVDVFGGSLLDSGGGDIAITGAAVQRSAGGVFVRQSQILSGGGDIELAGYQENNSRGSGGLHLEESSVDAGGGQVTLSAGIGDGIGDAIVLRGSTIASTTAVNLHPINVNDTILLGAGNGFSLTGAELAMIDSPLVVIGGAQHAGAIRVLEAVDWDGDLTLQNQGGDAGIDLQAAVDVGDNILTLASGGDIGQTEAGGITAHSLLAIAGGNVALSSAENNVAASSLAGSAGGDFSYEDVDDLAISEVSSFGFSSVGQTGLVSLSAAGITAGGSVLVRTATGNLTLGADVSGNTIDLVAAETFQNTAGATLFAAEGWRVWARTWEGEQRGGLQNDDAFDIYGCAFGADCLGLGQGNQFVYQRILEIPRPPETVAALVDGDDEGEDPLEQVHAGMVCPVGANAADPLGKGSGSDELAREWSKTRHRIRLSGCIDNSSQGGCRF